MIIVIIIIFFMITMMMSLSDCVCILYSLKIYNPLNFARWTICNQDDNDEDDDEDEDDVEDEDDRNTFDGQIALGSLAGSRSVTRNLSIKNVGC